MRSYPSIVNCSVLSCHDNLIAFLYLLHLFEALAPYHIYIYHIYIIFLRATSSISIIFGSFLLMFILRIASLRSMLSFMSLSLSFSAISVALCLSSFVTTRSRSFKCSYSLFIMIFERAGFAEARYSGAFLFQPVNIRNNFPRNYNRVYNRDYLFFILSIAIGEREDESRHV